MWENVLWLLQKLTAEVLTLWVSVLVDLFKDSLEEIVHLLLQGFLFTFFLFLIESLCEGFLKSSCLLKVEGTVCGGGAVLSFSFLVAKLRINEFRNILHDVEAIHTANQIDSIECQQVNGDVMSRFSIAESIPVKNSEASLVQK